MIACLSVPYFAAVVEQRNDPSSTDKSSPRSPCPGLVIGGQPWEPQPVFAFSREVAKQGVKPGMSLRLAHFLSPRAHFISATPPRYFSASGEITDVLTDFTHLVEPEELWAQTAPALQELGVAFGRSLPVRYTLDLESLPEAEAFSLTQEIGRTVRKHTHLAPAIGLADGKFAAQVAATLTRPHHIRTVSSGKEAQFLASRTIHFLPLDRETARRLSLLGIRTLGQLTALPLAGLQAQFPAQTSTHLYRLARGWEGDPHLALRPLSQEKQEQVTHQFEAPITNILILERVLAHMAAELAGRLQSAGLEGRTLHLDWEVAGGRHQQAATTSLSRVNLSRVNLSRRQPTADPQKLAGTLCELLHQACLNQPSLHQSDNQELNDFEHGITALTVTLTDLTPASAWQPTLFDSPRAINGVQGILHNLTAKHGAGYFYRPVVTDSDHPLPERRFQLQELVPV